MPSRKKSPLPKDTTIELESSDNPWIAAYQKVLAYDLKEGETTIRKFMADCRIETYYKAKEAMLKLVKEGLAVEAGRRTVRQSGLKPSVVNIYRLTNAD